MTLVSLTLLLVQDFNEFQNCFILSNFQLNQVSNSHDDILLIFSNETILSVVKSDVIIVTCETYNPAFEIKFFINSELPFVDNTNKYFDFRHANYTEISKFHNSYNWLEAIRLLNVNSSTDTLHDALHYCEPNFVPEIIYTSCKFLHWFYKDLKYSQKKSSILNIKRRGVL